MNNVKAVMKLAFNVRGVSAALTSVAGTACKFMANDTREKTVNYIMGNRSRSNPFPKNRVNPRTGKYYANSVARKWPGSPKSYVRPKDPISLSQVEFAHDRRESKKIASVGGISLAIQAPTYVVGPIGSSGGKTGVPRTLESGGTTTGFYREVKKNGTTVRWEFRRHKPKAPAPSHSQNTGRPKGKPVRYGSWTEANAVMRARGQQVGGRRKRGTPHPDADAAFAAQGWLGPSTFNVRPRPYIGRAWDKVRKRSKYHISVAARKLPQHYRKYANILTAA